MIYRLFWTALYVPFAVLLSRDAEDFASTFALTATLWTFSGLLVEEVVQTRKVVERD